MPRCGRGSPDVRRGLSGLHLQSGILVPLSGRGALQVRRTPWLSGPRPQGHTPPPGKRNFPIDVPSKEVGPKAGRSAQAPPPQRLRNAGRNETQRCPQHRLCLVAVIPTWGAGSGVNTQRITTERTTTAHSVAANTQTPEGFESQKGSNSCSQRGQGEWAVRCAGFAFLQSLSARKGTVHVLDSV